MLNPFKRKKSKESSIKSKKTEEKELAPVKDALRVSGSYPLGVIVAPRITEKTANLKGFGKYVFEVRDNANAFMIKHAVEKKYGVKIVKVNVLSQHGKKVRLGRQLGWQKGFKKAIVTLAKGQSIEFT